MQTSKDVYVEGRLEGVIGFLWGVRFRVQAIGDLRNTAALFRDY